MPYSKSTIVVLVIYLLCRNIETCIPVSISVKQNEDFKNEIIPSLELWNRTVSSRLECCVSCYEDELCFSFHFSPVDGVCIGILLRHDDSVSTTTAAGYSLYDIDKGNFCP